MSVNPAIVCCYLFLRVFVGACAYERLSHVRNHHGDHVEECIYQSIPSKTCVWGVGGSEREEWGDEHRRAFE